MIGVHPRSKINELRWKKIEMKNWPETFSKRKITEYLIIFFCENESEEKK
jgi:hypothetical protein